jgi:hypothetical protein
MEDKLQHSKREMETAAKLIDKLHEERKQMKQRIKNKNAVVMQQEQQIQQRQLLLLLNQKYKMKYSI